MQITVKYGSGFEVNPPKEVESKEVDLPQSIAMREKVDLIARGIIDSALPQIECPIRHHFAPGMYGREISIPAGTVLIGAVHKTDNLVVLSKGLIRMVTEDGFTEIAAPHTMMCKAGTRNAGLIVEDSVWTNFFPTLETDPDKLIELLTESTADEILGGKNNEQLLAMKAKQLEV
jgi:hypothetical protein